MSYSVFYEVSARKIAYSEHFHTYPSPEIPPNRRLGGCVGRESGVLGLKQLPEPRPLRYVLLGVGARVGGDT